MSVLETFYILFDTDAKKAQADMDGLEKSAEETAKAMDKVGKVDTAGVKALANATDDAADQAKRLDQNLTDATQPAGRLKNEIREADHHAGQLGRSFGRVLGPLIAMGAAAFSFGSIVGGVVAEFRGLSEVVEKANRFNISPEGYVALQGVLEDAGGNVDMLDRAFRRLGDTVSKGLADGDKGPGATLAKLGVSATDAAGNLRDMEAVLVDVAGAVEGMRQDQAITHLRDLGIIDPAMIDTVLKGKEALRGLIQAERDKGVIDNQTAQSARQLKLTIDDVKDAWTSMKMSILGAVLPTLQKLADWLVRVTTWLKQNPELVKGFAIGLVAALGVVTAFLWAAYIPAWIAAAAAVVAATWPILAVIAVIGLLAAAFALAWEDVQFFLKGQPSLIGDLLSRYEWLRKGVDAIGRALSIAKDVAIEAWGLMADEAKTFGDVVAWVFGYIWRIAGPIFSLLTDAFKLVGDVQATMWGLAWEAANALFGALWPLAQPVIDAMIEGFKLTGMVLEWAAGLALRAWEGFFGRFEQRMHLVIALVRQLMGWIETARAGLEKIGIRRTGGDGAAQGALTGRGMLAAARDTPLAAQSSGALAAGSNTRNTNVKIDKVDVNTQATDAKGIAGAFSDSLQSELTRGVNQFNDGVAR